MTGSKQQEIINNRMTFRQNFTEEYDFLMDLDGREDNPFLQSLYRQFIQHGTLSAPQRNSIMKAKSYQEAKQKKEELKEVHKDDEPTGSYVGTLKTRYDMVLKLISVRDTSRGFWVHTFQDRAGNQLMSFSNRRSIVIDSVDGAITLIQGDCFTCRATVNRHSVNDFNPEKKIKQTVINRIKYNKYLGNKKLLEEVNG